MWCLLESCFMSRLTDRVVSELQYDRMEIGFIHQRHLYWRQLLQVVRGSFYHSPSGLCEIMSNIFQLTKYKPKTPIKQTHSDFLKFVESFGVPSWSTNFRIPCTFILIFSTCSESDDCSCKKSESSCDWGIAFEDPCGAYPVSMSWKLMAN